MRRDWDDWVDRWAWVGLTVMMWVFLIPACLFLTGLLVVGLGSAALGHPWFFDSGDCP